MHELAQQKLLCKLNSIETGHANIDDIARLKNELKATGEWDVDTVVNSLLPEVRKCVDMILNRDDQWRENRLGKAIEFLLVDIGSPAVEPLIAALKDENRCMRKGAAHVLGCIKDPRAVKPLIEVLNDDYVGAKAAWALDRIPPWKENPAVKEAIPRLIELANNNREELVRLRAVEALAASGDPRAVKPLISALKDKGNSSIRCKAANGLEALKDEEAVGPLIDAWRTDTSGDLKQSAVLALDKIDPEWQRSEIVRQEITNLTTAFKHKDKEVRAKAAESLGQAKSMQAVEALIEALKDEARTVRSTAAGALGNIKDARAIEPLIDALNDKEDYWVRSSAATALGLIGDARSVEPLTSLLKEKREPLSKGLALSNRNTVLRHAVEALGMIEDASAVEALLALLKHDDSVVRHEAICSLHLNHIERNGVADLLIEALKLELLHLEKDDYIRNDFEERLDRIGGINKRS
jgi:HEAT repeat protein